MSKQKTSWQKNVVVEENDYMKLVQEIAVITLRVGNTPIWILSADYRAIGKVKWMLSGNDLPGQMEGDPVRYDIDHPPGELENVEVLLLQGN